MTDEREQIIRQGVKDGLSFAEIAEKLGYSRPMIYLLANKWDIPRPTRKKHWGQWYKLDRKRRWLRTCINRKLTKAQGREMMYEQLKESLPDTCPIFGLPLEYGEGTNRNNWATLDRIDPTKGYVPGNIAVLSHQANRLKNNATPDELRKIADWIDTQLRAK